MERKIGEIFEYNGDWYQCVEQSGCAACSFRNNGTICHSLGCSELVVRDSTPVIFKKLEKVGEPMEFARGTYFQRYRLADSTVSYKGAKRLFTCEPAKEFVYIEIKQNKEDMEENYKAEDTPLTRLVGRYVNNLIDYETFEKAVKELYSDKEEHKPTLKEFDLEAAKLGKPVCTRDGRKARIICFDRKCSDCGDIIALVNDCNKEIIYTYFNDGRYYKDSETPNDLMMLTEKERGLGCY